MILRVLAGILFISAGAAAGVGRADKLRKDLEICRSTGILLRSSSAMIRSSGVDVYRLACELEKNESLSNLSFLKKIPKSFSPETDFHNEWSKCVSEAELPKAERDILLCFGAELGRSDISGQLAAIGALEAEIAETEKIRRDELIQKGRLYRSVGILLGAMTGILVI